MSAIELASSNGDGVIGEATPTATIRVEHLTKNYTMGHTVVHALRGVSMEVYPDDFVAVWAPRGRESRPL